MSVMKKGPAVPAWLAAGLIGLALGAAGGFYGASFASSPAVAANGPAAGGGAGGAPGGGQMGGMGGGMGGGARDHPQALTLVRTIGALTTLEKARGKELSSDQRRKVQQAAQPLTSGATMTEAQCEAKLTEIKAALNPAQQALLEEMTARPGGGRGGPGGAGGAPGGAGAPGNGPGAGSSPGSGPGGGGPAGMGGGTNYEKPFAEGRGRERLEELLGLLGK
jgi:translation initiation factor IF-2